MVVQPTERRITRKFRTFQVSSRRLSLTNKLRKKIKIKRPRWFTNENTKFPRIHEIPFYEIIFKGPTSIIINFESISKYYNTL